MDANETLVLLLAVGVSAFYAVMVFTSYRRRSAPSVPAAEPRVAVGRAERRPDADTPPGGQPTGK